MATTTLRNGIDVGRLTQTIDAIKDDSGVAQFTFKANTKWKEGATNSAEISSLIHAGEEQSHVAVHRLIGDEPNVLLGNDNGPNAVELVLAALGFCYSIGFVYNAAALGYDLEGVEYEVEGDLDLRNFVGIGEDPRPGFKEIRVTGRARAANASEEELQKLCQYVQDTSPVKDVLSNPVPVKTTLEVTG
jgi:uncharacterized OsmC-like protein